MSFRLRLLISFSLLIALTFGAGGALLISTSFQSMLNEEKASAIRAYETMQNNLLMLNFFGEDGDYTNMSSMLSQMEEQNSASWQAISLISDNENIYESGDLSLLSGKLPIEDVKHYAYTVASDEKGRRLQMYSELSSDKEILYLKASFDLSAAYSLRENQQKMFLIIYGVVILLGVVMASILAYALTRRLQSLTTTVRQITGGELSRRSAIRSNDEFGQLSRDFDAMADRLQENILQLEEDVQRKEAFMGAVAHELKTPMTSIIGYADLLRQCALNEGDQIAAANYIFKEGKRLEKLSFKLLDLLMMEKDITSMKEVKLDVFLRDVVRALLPRARQKQVELYWKCESATVILEPDLVKSLLYNLVDNAIKSMNTDDNVSEEDKAASNTVNAEKNKVMSEHVIRKSNKEIPDSERKQNRKQIPERVVLIRGKPITGGCEIQVVDNGCGMEQAELSRITEAFYRVDKSRSRRQGGAGLGLTLCKKIVDLHHGNMTFRSVKGKGSWVTIELYGSRRDMNEEV